MCKGCIAKLDELHLSGWHFISTGECHQILSSGGFSTMCSRKRREFGCIRIQNWIFNWICKIVMTKIRIRFKIFRNVRKVKNAWIGDVLGVIFRGGHADFHLWVSAYFTSDQFAHTPGSHQGWSFGDILGWFENHSVSKCNSNWVPKI